MLSNSHDTTANIPYIGRFAPSPTGPLHFGSLLAALASYLDAHSHGGKWLIRMEDLDPPREMPNAQERILEALDTYQLFSDEPIVYQSQRSDLYQQALNQLIKNNLVFPCTCSRKQLSSVNGIHFGNCYSSIDSDVPAFAWRFNCQSLANLPTEENDNVSFQDVLQGKFQQSLQEDIGDFVVKRKDQLWAYQLAMVADDYHQGVTHVVRGIDLIDSTLRQNMLHTALNYPKPSYAHIPVACAENGQKLSKQNLAPALDLSNPNENLWLALSWLRQKPPENLRTASVKEMLDWGIAHWDIKVLSNIQSQAAI
jgi:glutamyl-Q tRNA(Asp) synthetase